MTKISSLPAYEIKDIISPNDYFIGTDSQTDNLETVNFMFDSVRKFALAGLSPETGGTLRITEITYTGTAYATAAALLNSMDPIYTIDRYHLLVVSINGVKSLLKSQSIVVGLEQPQVSVNDFILFPTSTGVAGPQGIQGIQGPQGIQGNIGQQGSTGVSGSNGATGAQGATGSQGIQGVAGNNGADASNNLQRDASSSFTVSDSDNNYVIQLKNTSAIIITIPASGLRSKFNVGFSRLGAGEVSFVGDTGVTLQNPIGYRISRQFDPCYIERDVATQVYTLYGQTKI